MSAATILDKYAETLLDFCRTHSEDALYEASLISEQCIRDGLGPDDIVGAHWEAFQKITQRPEERAGDRVRLISNAHHFLLEVMIGYGVKYREFLEARLAEATREAEAILRQERARAEAAVASEQEKLDLIGVIAHEIRTPLTIARGNAEHLARELSGAGGPHVEESRRDLRQALERLETLSNHLLEARVDEPPGLDLVPVNVSRVVETCARWARQLAEEKGVTVERTTEPGLLVEADEDALQSIVTNLLSNAIRYTPAGGSITVACRRSGDAVSVEVADTGIGMSKSVQERMFEKFFRGPDAKRASSNGLGMGLVIVDRLVKAHGASLHVESEEGIGTTFRLFLPRLREEGEGS